MFKYTIFHNGKNQVTLNLILFRLKEKYSDLLQIKLRFYVLVSMEFDYYSS